MPALLFKYFCHATRGGALALAGLFLVAANFAVGGQSLVVFAPPSMQGLVAGLADGVKREIPACRAQVKELDAVASLIEAARVGSVVLATDRPLEVAFREELSVAPYQWQESVVALETIVLAVHPSNPVREISLDQLAGVWRRAAAGQRVTWGDLGAPAPWAQVVVHFLGHDAHEGTRSWVLAQLELGYEVGPTLTPSASSTEVVEAVAHDPAALGYVSALFLHSGVRALSLRAAGMLHGVSPTTFATGQGLYPLTRSVYLTSISPADSLAVTKGEQFVAFARTQRGQRCVRLAGFSIPEYGAATAVLGDTGFSR